MFSLLIAACTDQPPLRAPSPTPFTIPPLSTHGATSEALPVPTSSITSSIIIEAPIITSTRPAAPAPRFNPALPDLSALPPLATQPDRARLLTTLKFNSRNPDGKPEPARALAFSPDRRLLAVADRSEIWIIDLADGKVTQSLFASANSLEERGASSLAFSRDSGWLAAGGLNGSITLFRWEKSNGKFRGSARLASNPFSGAFGDTVEVAFSPDNRWLGGFGSDGTINLYDLSTGAVKISFAADFAGYLAWSPDSLRLADEYLTLHHLDSGQSLEPEPALSITSDTPQGVGWSPDGRWLAASANGFEVIITEVPGYSAGQSGSSIVKSGAKVPVRTVPGGQAKTSMSHLKEGRRVAWSPDSERVAVANVPEAGKISVWDNSGNLLLTLSAGNEIIRGLELPYNNMLVTADNNGDIKFFQLLAPPPTPAPPGGEIGGKTPAVPELTP